MAASRVPLSSPFFAGILDREGSGSTKRTLEERQALLSEEVSSPQSTFYRPIKPYGLQKLENLRSYLWSYSLILNRYFPLKFAVVDGFAGPGVLDLRPQPPESVRRFDEAPTSPELTLGSPLLELSNHPHYPVVHLVEKDHRTFEALQSRVESYYPQRANLHHGDSNALLPGIAENLGGTAARALFVLDPEGLELKMGTLHKVRALYGGAEILVLYPSYMAVARCIRVRSTWARLREFFGDDLAGSPDGGWEAILHRFDDDPSWLTADSEETPMRALHDQLLEYYKHRLGAAGFEGVISSPVVRNDRKRPLYHLVFAGNNATGVRIMRQIFGGEATRSLRPKLEAFHPKSDRQESGQ
jgi:three-Cys-motif partner protein